MLAGDCYVSQVKYEKHINVLNPIRLNLMIIPKYSTHLSLCTLTG